MQFLITAGGTREPIDGVRYIGNTSSGRTGALLADHLQSQGHDVVWLGAQTALQPTTVNDCHYYVTHQQLSDGLRSLLSHRSFDAVFHAAAVSDYKVDSVTVNGESVLSDENLKINSAAENVQINLSPQPKIITQLKQWSEKQSIQVVGFKLTHTKDPVERNQAIEKLLSNEGVSAVAHNDLNDIHEHSHPFTLHVPGRSPFACDDILGVYRVLATLWEMGA